MVKHRALVQHAKTCIIHLCLSLHIDVPDLLSVCIIMRFRHSLWHAEVCIATVWLLIHVHSCPYLCTCMHARRYPTHCQTHCHTRMSTQVHACAQACTHTYIHSSRHMCRIIIGANVHAHQGSWGGSVTCSVCPELLLENFRFDPWKKPGRGRGHVSHSVYNPCVSQRVQFIKIMSVHILAWSFFSWQGIANPMDTPSARGAVLGPTLSGQSGMGRAGSSCRMPQISSKVKSGRNKSSSNCLDTFKKWDLDAAAFTLGSRAQGRPLLGGPYTKWKEDCQLDARPWSIILCPPLQVTYIKGIPGGGMLGKPSPSSSPSPPPFIRHCLPNFTCLEVN